MTDNIIKVLVVEPIDETRKNILKLLAFESRFQTDSAAAIETAREQLTAFQPDVILMSVDLPNSFALVEEIRQVQPHVAVVMMSVSSEAELMRRAMLAGAIDFLVKPIAADTLYETLDRVYDRSIRRATMQGYPASAEDAPRDYDLDDILTAEPDYELEDADETQAVEAEPAEIPDWLEDADEAQAPEPSRGIANEQEKEVRQDREEVDKGVVSAAPPPMSPSPAPAAPPQPSIAQPSRQPEVLKEFLNPQFTAFYPKFVQAAQPYALMVFVHIESVIAQVRRTAEQFMDMMGKQQTSTSAPSQVQIAKGTILTLVPQVQGLTFTPAEQVLTWDGTQPQQSATFLFQPPAEPPAEYTGRVLVFNGPLIVGEIPLHMKRSTQPMPRVIFKGQDAESQLKELQPIFASYSHRDTPVMEYFRSTRARLGQKMLVDIYDLRAGEHWADRLLNMIDESAIFQLFWSRHSAESKYCQQEWEHALTYLEKRDRFIQPVWWDTPMPPPPPELANLHFQKISLPPITRFQMMMHRFRGLFS